MRQYPEEPDVTQPLPGSQPGYPGRDPNAPSAPGPEPVGETATGTPVTPSPAWTDLGAEPRGPGAQRTAPGQPAPPEQRQPAYRQPPSIEGVRLSELVGRAIVDRGSGTKLGEVEDLVLSDDRRSVVGYATRGRFLQGPSVYPAQGSTIGEDAIMLPEGALQNFDARRLGGLPLARTLINMRLLTDTGRIVGTVKDLRVDLHSGTLLAYEVAASDGSFLQRLMHRTDLLPASAIHTFGQDALIASDAEARRHLGE